MTWIPDLTQLYVITLFVETIVFIIIYVRQKRFDSILKLVKDSIMDSITLNSGLLLLAYVAGKVFKIEYLIAVDDLALYAGLLIGGGVIIAGLVEKVQNEKKKKNPVKRLVITELVVGMICTVFIIFKYKTNNIFLPEVPWLILISLVGMALLGIAIWLGEI